jgi:hypothetical protein
MDVIKTYQQCIKMPASPQVQQHSMISHICAFVILSSEKVKKKIGSTGV